ncbi:MAG: winged helix-turn-helix domain-containing protein [Anaerolineales bacterium]|nr:winged helix-turn-helix domain-containing protein [Anaerolineales bacterium]
MKDLIQSQPVLVGQGGSLNGYRWSISGEIIIGRTGACEIMIPNQQVSRKHARIFISPHGPVLEDLSSKNGTFHNGKPVAELTNLEDGDVIQIALAQEFVFLGQDATVPLAPGDFESSVISYFRRIRLEKDSHRTWILNRELDPPLSLLQFKLLLLLLDSTGRVISRSEIINSVWGSQESVGVTDQALDALVRRLRERISELDSHHNYIITVRGQGYRLDNPPISSSGSTD